MSIIFKTNKIIIFPCLKNVFTVHSSIFVASLDHKDQTKKTSLSKDRLYQNNIEN